jgi:hypothetical protein
MREKATNNGKKMATNMANLICSLLRGYTLHKEITARGAKDPFRDGREELGFVFERPGVANRRKLPE